MPSMTYLEIVNRAITESKVSLDTLAEADFLDPPRTILYSMYKDWVNTSYEELYQDRPEWFFRNERAILTIRPRLHLINVATTLAVGDVLEGVTSGAQVEIVEVHTFEEAELNNSTETTVSVDFVDENRAEALIAGEQLNRITPTEDEGVADLLGLGYYDFRHDVDGLQDIDVDTVRIFDVPTEDDGTTVRRHTSNRALYAVPWSYAIDNYGFVDQDPQYISRTPYGSYAIFPMPLLPRNIEFDYVRKVGHMVNATDVPVALPEAFHMYLVWRTVMEFADFDNNAALFRRAKKHVDKYLIWLERDELPEIKFEASRFDL